MVSAARRVVVTQRFFDQATIDVLEQAGCEVVLAQLPPGRADGDLSHDELLERLQGAAGWIVGQARVTKDLMAALPELRIISRRGVGYDRVDLAAAEALGKVVCIAAGGNHESVADHTLALMLAVGRRFRESQARMIAGDWTILQSSDLYRKTVGVVGLGRIGQAVVRRLRAFEARILVCSSREDDPAIAGDGVIYAPLDQLLAESDYLTLHAPLSPQTRLIVDRGALARMKPTAFLINTARGGLIDDEALLDVLRKGELAGAGLDVFLSESDPSKAGVTQALLELPNVVATPHSAASSREGLDRTNMVAALSVIAVLDGRDPPADCIVADGRRS